jgi:hypothetical protein
MWLKVRVRSQWSREDEEVVLELAAYPTRASNGGASSTPLKKDGNFHAISFPVLSGEFKLLRVGPPVAVGATRRQGAAFRLLAMRDADHRPRQTHALLAKRVLPLGSPC